MHLSTSIVPHPVPPHPLFPSSPAIRPPSSLPHSHSRKPPFPTDSTLSLILELSYESLDASPPLTHYLPFTDNETDSTTDANTDSLSDRSDDDNDETDIISVTDTDSPLEINNDLDNNASLFDDEVRHPPEYYLTKAANLDVREHYVRYYTFIKEDLTQYFQKVNAQFLYSFLCWVVKIVAKKKGLSNAKRPSMTIYVRDLAEFAYLQIQLILLTSITGNRLEALVELRFQHLKLTLIRDPHIDRPRLFIKLTSKYTKSYLGIKDTNTFPIPEIIFNPTLILSPYIFLLGILFKMLAFKSPSINSLERLYSLNILDRLNKRRARRRLRNEMARQRRLLLVKIVDRFKKEQPVVDKDTRGLLLIDAILILPEMSPEKELQRRIAAIHIVIAYYKVEEERSHLYIRRSRPASSGVPIIAISSVISDKKLIKCFLCLRNQQLVVRERLRDYTTPSSLSRHFHNRHVKKMLA
ncbi:Protein of unknown function (DUF3435) domain containing protein [Hyaloscypha variabilis]